MENNQKNKTRKQIVNSLFRLDNVSMQMLAGLFAFFFFLNENKKKKKKFSVSSEVSDRPKFTITDLHKNKVRSSFSLGQC